MKELKRWQYFLKLGWIIGLVILANISLTVKDILLQMAKETFDGYPLIWLNLLVPFIFGIYISFIFIKQWTLNVNTTLLWFVSIPSLLISFCFPILVLLEKNWAISFSLIPSWLIRISSMEVFSIVAGFTLLLSMFENELTSSVKE
nr:hypothetical protein [Lysinibacillus timonensis]